MTVYADEAFLLNGAVDYLLLVCAAKLGGGRILRLRLALAAAFGGVYAAAALFPALAFLRQLPVKLASLAAMLLIAFGAGRGTLRTGALFFAAVCAFGGAAVADCLALHLARPHSVRLAVCQAAAQRCCAVVQTRPVPSAPVRWYCDTIFLRCRLADWRCAADFGLLLFLPRRTKPRQHDSVPPRCCADGIPTGNVHSVPAAYSA